MYDVMLPPPLLAGAFHVTRTDWFRGVVVRMVGADETLGVKF
jgi:hypothetical protein